MTIQSGIPVARIELLDALQVRALNAYSKLALPEKPTAVARIPRLRSRRRRTGGAVRRDRAGIRRRPVRVGDQGRGSHAAVAGAARRLLGAMRAAPRLRGAGDATSACRSRGWPNVSPKPSAISRRASWSARSSATSATAISTSALLVDLDDNERSRARRVVPRTAGRARAGDGRHLHRRARRRPGQDEISEGRARRGGARQPCARSNTRSIRSTS